MGNHSPNQIFDKARAALDHGAFDMCLGLLRDLEKLVGPHTAICHLRSNAYRKSGDLKAALQWMDQAIQLCTTALDPILLANKAHLLEAMGQTDLALQHIRDATALAPERTDIRLSHIAMLRRLDGDAAALTAFDKLLSENPDDGELHHELALFLLDNHETERALIAINKTIKLRPNSVNARHLKARIKLDMGQPDISAFDEALALAPNDRSIILSKAAALARLNQTDLALDLLDHQIAQEPDWVEGLQTRTAMAWQAGQGRTSEIALERAAKALPQHSGVQLALIYSRMRMFGPDEGLQTLQDIPSSLRSMPEFQEVEAGMLSRLGRHEEADRLFNVLGTAQPSLSLARLRHQILAGRFEQAAALAEAIARQTNLIEAWAYLLSLWQVLGDERWHWLGGHPNFIRTIDLPDFDELAEPLADILRRKHAGLAKHPLEQSPRGGTQTDGMLFASAEPEIRQVLAMIRDAIADYVASLPPIDPTHPLLSAPRRTWRFSGSWSIRLLDKGFHKAHFHNEGALSSALYVHLPDDLGTAGWTEKQQGWLELGVPPIESGLNLEPLRLTEPKVGRLALFPSYMWHGTRPFEAGERMTIAFDAVPLRP